MLTNLPVETSGLIIEELNPSDADELYEFMSLPEIQEFIPDRFDSLDEL